MPVQPQGCRPTPYRPRRPADTPRYRVVQNHLETFLALCHDDGEEERVTPHAEWELRRFLECGILAYGFDRARCDEYDHDFLIAFSCKGRGICLSCNTRRMAETAAHLADHILPRLPVRKWVRSVTKRLRYPPPARPRGPGQRPAHLPQCHRAAPAQPLPRRGTEVTNRRGGLHPPIRVFTQRTHPLPCLRHRRHFRARSGARRAVHPGRRPGRGGRRGVPLRRNSRASPSPSRSRSTSTINVCPGRAVRRGAAGPAAAARTKLVSFRLAPPSKTAAKTSRSADFGVPITLQWSGGA